MIAADTNVFVRVLLLDDVNQAKIAEDFLSKTTQKGGLFVSSFTILELAWVLKSQGKSKEEIVTALEKIVNAQGVKISARTVILAALARFRVAPNSVGLADCLILSDALENGAKLATFDENLRKFDSRCIFP